MCSCRGWGAGDSQDKSWCCPNQAYMVSRGFNRRWLFLPKEFFCVPIITSLREDADTNNRWVGQNCGAVMPLQELRKCSCQRHLLHKTEPSPSYWWGRPTEALHMPEQTDSLGQEQWEPRRSSSRQDQFRNDFLGIASKGYSSIL